MRYRHRHRFVHGLAATLCIACLHGQAPAASAIDPQLQDAARNGASAAFIARFGTAAQLQQIIAGLPAGDRGAQRTALLQALHARADADQGPALGLLQAAGVQDIVVLWAIDAVAARAPLAVIEQLAGLPGVQSVVLDASVALPPQSPATASTAQWNLDAIRAPEFWGLGYTGSGVVVAGMDTGVDVEHPDLAPRWRGGGNSWFDPNGEHAAPHDAAGHGTRTMGLLVGGDAGGSAIGVAPGAQWIAVKIFDDSGTGLLSGIHQGFQWLLDPDADPATDDAPDVVNNSWGFPTLVDQCYLEFETDIELLKAAGIAVVFSAGNQGPAAATSESPANNPEGFAVGALDSALGIAATSSRGASACDGTFYPEVAAPGVNVRTADLTAGGLFPDSYAVVSGTSAAAPHVAGAMALLREAFPGAGVAALEQAVTGSALDLGPAGPDNDYGHGLVDVVAAADWLASQPPPPLPPQCTDSDGDGYFAEADCGTEPDCDDGNAGISPAACDIKDDGIDQDCDGADRQKGKSCPGDGGGGNGGGGSGGGDGGGSEGKGDTCGDGIDNDGDGLIDCQDDGCSKNRVCR